MKINHRLHRLHRLKKICEIGEICGFLFFSLSPGEANGPMNNCHETPRRGDPHKALRAIFRRPYWSAEDFHSSPGEANGLMNNCHEISHEG